MSSSLVYSLVENIKQPKPVPPLSSFWGHTLTSQDTCTVPCSATWPCFAACTPAGCQPAGRPISGPGLSVSVRGGSGSCWRTLSSPGFLLLLPQCPPVPAPPRVLPSPPLLRWFLCWRSLLSECAVHQVAVVAVGQEDGLKCSEMGGNPTQQQQGGAVCHSST